MPNNIVYPNYNNVFTNVLNCLCAPSINITRNGRQWSRTDAVCGDTVNRKVLSLTQPPGYLGTSQKMAYGKYCRTRPGLTTFANKKTQDRTVNPSYVQQPTCTSLGKQRDARRLTCQITNIHPRVAQKMQCVNNQTCRVADFAPAVRPLPTAFPNNQGPFKMYF